MYTAEEMNGKARQIHDAKEMNGKARKMHAVKGILAKPAIVLLGAVIRSKGKG